MDYLTSAQISEWEVVDRLDPIGEDRGDLRMAELASVISNCFIGAFAKKGTKLTAPIDFMPDWTGDEKEPKKQTAEEIKAIFLGIAQEQNRRIRKMGTQTRHKLPKREVDGSRDTNS